MSFPIITILIIVLIGLAFALSFSTGANDETLAPLAGANIFKFKFVLMLGGVALACGLIFLSQGVSKTVGSDILGPDMKYSTYMLLAVLIGSITWLILGSLLGLPLSSTHCIIGSVFGVVIIYALFQGDVELASAFNNDLLINIVISWFLSPIFGFLISYMIFKTLGKFHLFRLKGLNQIEKSERLCTWLLLFSVLGCGLFAGGNDGGKIVGLLYGLYNNGSINISQYFFFVVVCGIFVFLGIYFVGRFVIKNLASQMTEARPSEGFVIQLSSMLILMVYTLLALPVSHTHVLVFAILGLNLAQKKETDYKALGKMIAFWILTFPIAALFAGFMYFGFLLFGFN